MGTDVLLQLNGSPSTGRRAGFGASDQTGAGCAHGSQSASRKARLFQEAATIYSGSRHRGSKAAEPSARGRAG